MPETRAMFGTDEILWWDNGRWGQAGYAIPNPAGKTWCNNQVVHQVHAMIGRQMFDLAHREDVKFYAAPHKQFLWDLHQLVTVARKRLLDRAIAPNDSETLDVIHAKPVPRAFLVYPIPFFEERIRQPDIREWCEITLMLQSEIMQHTDAERASDITMAFAQMCNNFLTRILSLMATKWFGYSREESYAPGFVIPPEKFASYDPTTVLTSVEQSEERQPLQWWPTENDLSEIRGIPINEALTFAKRWPATELLDYADGNVIVDNQMGAGAKGVALGIGVGKAP